MQPSDKLQAIIDLAKTCKGKKYKELTEKEKHAVLFLGHVGTIGLDTLGRAIQTPKGKEVALCPNSKLASEVVKLTGIPGKKFAPSSYIVYLEENIKHNFKYAELPTALKEYPTNLLLLSESGNNTHKDLPFFGQAKEMDKIECRKSITRLLQEIQFYVLYPDEASLKVKFAIKQIKRFYGTEDSGFNSIKLLLPGFDTEALKDLPRFQNNFNEIYDPDKLKKYSSELLSVLFWASQGIFLQTN